MFEVWAVERMDVVRLRKGAGMWAGRGKCGDSGTGWKKSAGCLGGLLYYHAAPTQYLNDAMNAGEVSTADRGGMAYARAMRTRGDVRGPCW